MSDPTQTDAIKKPSCCTPAAKHDAPPKPQSAVAPITATHGPSRSAISLPGGTFLMGTNYPDAFPADGEGPVRPVSLSPFAIDTYPVTNRDFTAFVSATNYLTESEHFQWSFVFWAHLPPERLNELVEDTVAAAPWWCKVPGAFWLHPEGPGSHIDDRPNHPVVHVSWNDAAAYAAWAGKSLPTEAQWEYAARGGLEQKLYPWGDELTPDELAPDGRPTGRIQHLCNIWQGEFPRLDTAEDGFDGPCPVDSFPPNPFGLYSITGTNQSHEGRLIPLPRLLLQPIPRSRSHLKHSRQCHLKHRLPVRPVETVTRQTITEIIPPREPTSDEHSGRR
jgi:formylglycine-generating enzyme